MAKILLQTGYVVSPHEVIKSGYVDIEGEMILGVGKRGASGKRVDIELNDYIMYPALINAHDHLLGTYLPKIGMGRPYLNWHPWDIALKASGTYKERGKNENIDIYFLGAYKNLLSGVLTVSDHIPHIINDKFIPRMPIRVLKDYSLAHEVSSYDLKWGDGVEAEHTKAVRNNEPFITHIEEGFDMESMKGIDYLLQMDALTKNTVLIHGIALSDKDIEVISRRQAHLVWCPVSNLYMFERTARIKEIMNAGVNVSLGTDSPASGSAHILEELKFAKKTYKQMYGEELSYKELVYMVTINPAKALQISDKLGSIEKGKMAEFVLIKDKGEDPYKTLVDANLEDISLVIYKGKPIYGDKELSWVFEYFNVSYKDFKLERKDKIINDVSDPLGLLYKIQKTLGFKKEFGFLPISAG